MIAEKKLGMSAKGQYPLSSEYGKLSQALKRDQLRVVQLLAGLKKMSNEKPENIPTLLDATIRDFERNQETLLP